MMKLLLLSKMDFSHEPSHGMSMENGRGGHCTLVPAMRLASGCNRSKDENQIDIAILMTVK